MRTRPMIPAPRFSAGLAVLLSMSACLSGCWDSDDTAVATPAPAPAPAPAASAPLTASQVAAAQDALDTTSSPVVVNDTASGSTDIAAAQTAIDQSAGLTTEAPR